MYFVNRVDALEIVHELAAPQASDTAIHHHALAVRAPCADSVRARPVQNVPLELKNTHVRVIETARSVTYQALIHMSSALV